MRDDEAKSVRRNVLIAAVAIFLLSFSVRTVISLNYEHQSRQVMTVLTDIYKMDASNLASGDLKTFLQGPNPPVDAHILSHPPGYSIFLAGIFSVFGDSDRAIKIVQTFADSMAVVLIFFLAIRFFSFAGAIVGAAFVALSPQLSIHSQSLLPESLSVLPIVAAILATSRFLTTKNIWMLVSAGVLIGISCWLRATALAFAPFLAVVVVALEGRKSLVPAIALVGAMLLTIAPVTIRNAIVFDKFIPLSLGSGVTLIGGIADYDHEGRFGLPRSDVEVAHTEAIEFGNPAYAGSLYNPDGLIREEYRLARGRKIIAENPLWFAGVLGRRAISMLEPERVPPVAPNVEFDDRSPAWAKFVGNVIWWPLKLLFAPALILLLIIVGLIIALRTATDRGWVLLLTVPAYSLMVQSAFHTEPRYTVGLWYFLLIFAGVSVAAAVGRLRRAWQSAVAGP